MGIGELLREVSPRTAQIVMSTSFRMFRDSNTAKGDKSDKTGPSLGAIAMQQMMRDIHFRHRLPSRPSQRRRRRELDALAYGA